MSSLKKAIKFADVIQYTGTNIEEIKAWTNYTIDEVALTKKDSTVETYLKVEVNNKILTVDINDYLVKKNDILEILTEKDFNKAYKQLPQYVEEFYKQLNFTKMDKSEAKDNIKDLIIWGKIDIWKLLYKATSITEDWIESTKALEIENKGVVIQVTTQQGTNITNNITFVPGVKIHDLRDKKGKIIGRKLI